MKRMKTPLLISLMLSALILSACNMQQDSKTILLKTSGMVEVKPDEASITLQLNCIDMDIKLSKACLIKQSDDISAELKSLGIKQPDIHTTGVNLNKEYKWWQNSQVFKGYRASTSLNVKVRDLTILEELYTRLLTREKLQIASLNYHHSEIDELNEQAYVKALNKANKLADKLLAELPESQKEITQVSNIEIAKSDMPPVQRMKMARAEADMGGGAVNVSIGNMIVEQQLYVEFKVY